MPGSGYKALDREGFDDGGVADLTLVIDLEDSVLRRKRGDQEYFNALRQDLLPRVTRGALAKDSRREQKIKLAKLLFSEEENEEDANPSEVYVENAVDGQEDPATTQHRLERLTSARSALTLSTVLREPACASLSLSEISKRRLAYHGKSGAEAALRCADKAIEIAGDGFYDTDEIDVEVCRDCVVHSLLEHLGWGLALPSSLVNSNIAMFYLAKLIFIAILFYSLIGSRRPQIGRKARKECYCPRSGSSYLAQTLAHSSESLVFAIGLFAPWKCPGCLGP